MRAQASRASFVYLQVLGWGTHQVVQGKGARGGTALVPHTPQHLPPRFPTPQGAFSVRGVAPPRFKRYAVDTSAWPPRFCKLEVVFSGGVRLALTDPRRLARVTRVKGDPLASPPLSALAPDAWLTLPPVPAFAAALAARSMPIKALLLDQNKVVSGIGNWLIDEFLYQARLHPESHANALSPADVKALHGAIVRVLDTACAADADSEKFPADWLFSHRWGKGKGKSTGPDGSPITFITVGGRTSAVVLKVQGAPKKKRSDAAEVEEAAVGAGGDSEGAAGKAKGKASAGKRSSGGARKAAAAAAAAAAVDGAPAPSKKRRAAAAPVDASTKGSTSAPSKKRRTAAAASVVEAQAVPAPLASTKGHNAASGAARK